METKCKNKLEAKVKENSIHYDYCLSVSSVGNSGGLMLPWKETDVTIMSNSLGHIDACITENDCRWRFTGIYNNTVMEDELKHEH